MTKKSKQSSKDGNGTASSKADETNWGDELMTTRELMEFLSLSRTKIWDLVKNEGLPAFKIGGDYRYRRSEILAWMEKYRVKK